MSDDVPMDVADSLRDLADFLDLAAVDPLAAADLADSWADDLSAGLREAARQLRAAHAAEKPDTISEGGIRDRVRACVVGPDGQVRGIGGSN